MNLQRQRPWITPLVMGSFLLLTITGILMFFHLDSGLNKVAHEWLSWMLVVGVALHVGLNLPAFKRYLAQRTARWVVGVSVVVLAASFVRLPGSAAEPPFIAPAKALASAPLPVLAQVAGVSSEVIKQRLAGQRINVIHDQQSVADLVGPDVRRQMNALTAALAAGSR
jgi:Domain of unknown function (DUF4405)